MAEHTEPDPGSWDGSFVDRAVLSDSAEGRAIATEFIATFGDFVSERVRPQLRAVAAAGGEPQLLVNGLAQLLRSVADSIELPPGERGSRSSVDPPTPEPGGAAG
jgi:hypothetical protein